jgi:DNA-binding MarR family transcriptional regulator
MLDNEMAMKTNLTTEQQHHKIRPMTVQTELPEYETHETAERNVGFLLNDTARQMRTIFDRRMRDLGLTRSQWWVLNHLYFNEGLSQTSLSEILEIERATLGRLLDRLEAKGWIERRSVEADRRVKLVFLAGAVDPLLQTMRAVAANLRSEALADLPVDEQERFISTLIKIKNNLSNMVENGNGVVGSTIMKDHQNG